MALQRVNTNIPVRVSVEITGTSGTVVYTVPPGRMLHATLLGDGACDLQINGDEFVMDSTMFSGRFVAGTTFAPGATSSVYITGYLE